MVCDPSVNYTIALNDIDEQVIYDAIIQNNFFDLKSDMTPSAGVMCEPSYSLTLQITANQKTHTVKWRCGFSEDDSDYKKLKEITKTIQDIISQKEKEMSVPEPRCGYL